ncbi:hypothetical protein FXW00_00120 [Staphylococcus pseudintermedius]|nr:hypothetical protein [Staphylococcus pseudintermedius]
MVIADCGLPIPEGVKRIDIALKKARHHFKKCMKRLCIIWSWNKPL